LIRWQPLIVGKKFSAFHGNRRFRTMFTRARHWCVLWAPWIQFTPSYPISLQFVLKLLSHICFDLPSGPFSYGFRLQFCMHFSSVRAFFMHRPSHRSWYDYTNNIRRGVKLWNSLLFFFHSSVISQTSSVYILP